MLKCNHGEPNLFNRFETAPFNEKEEDYMVPVFENGEILKEWTFAEVRENAKLIGYD